MSRRKFVKDYLTVNKKETIGTLIFLLLCIIFISYNKFSKTTSNSIAIKEDSTLAKAIDTLKAKKEFNRDYEEENFSYQFEPTVEKRDFTKGELFEFDPNTLDNSGWKKLGLADKTIKTINNYRTKGGKFYKPEDFKKIWGLPAGFYERVKDHINITSVQRKTFDSPTYTQTKYTKPERKVASVNINQSDTSAFIALPGIGSKLAARITNFRDKLGGFYSIDQIGETYGLPDSTFQKIKPYLQVDASQVKKFNLNSATKDELKVHPYIKWNLANAIVEYRNQHGSFKSINDLKKIVLIDDATFNKIAPYFTL